MTKKLLTLMTIILLSATAEAIEVSNCTEISSPDHYMLTQDLTPALLTPAPQAAEGKPVLAGAYIFETITYDFSRKLEFCDDRISNSTSA